MPTPNNFRVKSGLTVGTTISGGNTTITGFVNATSSVNATSHTVGTALIANSTGVFTTGAVNAASLAVGTNFIANTTRVVIGTAVGLQANGGIGTAGQVLTSNATTVYWSTPTTGTVTSIATANGLSGGPITSTGTIGVTTGPTLTVNTTGIHVNSTLSLTDLTLSGNLTVNGTRTYVNTVTLDVGDNIITLNADIGATAPTQDAGIEIMRGTSANVQFIWDETNDRWTTNGQPMSVATLLAGNTSITGFANVSTTLQVGTNTATFGTAAYIVANGNFGVGTTTPAQKLDVAGLIQLTTNYADVRMLTSNGYGWRIASGSNGSNLDKLYFQSTTNSFASAASPMVIDSNGNTGIANTTPANKLFVTGDIGLDGISVRDTATATTTATTQITLFEYPIATYDSCDVIIKAVSGGARHTTKLLVTANSTVAIGTEYGTLLTGSSLFTVDCDISGANTRIRITPASATSTVFKSSYELITA